MKIYKNIKNGTKIGLIIAMIFVIIGIGYSIYNLIDSKTVPDKMVEAQDATADMTDAQEVPAMPDTKEPPAEMIGEGKPVPAASPEVPTAGIPGYVKDIIYLLIYVLTGFYALLGYKKPHGNMLKYLYMIFAVGLVLNVCLGNADKNAFMTAVSISTSLAALILVYVSGRFHKIEKNRVLLILAGVLLFASAIIPMFSDKIMINGFLNACSPLIMLLALGFAYTARFEEHKAAGLEDGK